MGTPCKKNSSQEDLACFKQIAENSEGVFWLTTPALDRLLYVSPAYEKIWGRSCASLYQDPRSFLAFIHPQDLPEVQLQFLRMGQGKPVKTLDYRIIQPDGSVRTILTQVFPLRDEGGNLFRLASISLDRSAQAQREDQAHQARQMGAISRLAGGVAHDFNNQLTIINGYTELLLNDPRLAAVTAKLMEIRKAGERAAALTEQLLAFGRKQQVQRRRILLNEAIAQKTGMLQSLVGAATPLEISLQPEAGSIGIDPAQLDQILRHLAINAREAMPQGGRVRIAVSNAWLDETNTRSLPDVPPGAYVQLAISDTGSGMSPEVKARIFEPFFSARESGLGAGLGLATVYGIVKQNQGHILVESALGQGTTFLLYFPCLEEESRLPAPGGPRAAEGAANQETILVVEDEEAVRMMLTEILQSAGYRVLAASSPVEAIPLVRQHGQSLRLLITDIIMPQMNGMEMVAQLATEGLRLKTIFMSGYTNGILHDLEQSGFPYAYLQKPFSGDNLLRTVRQALAES